MHVRVRPGVENGVWATAETVIHNTVNTKTRYVFSKVHPTTCTNTSLFRGVEPLVHRVLEGSHVTVMAYGQTGSGKTHSMLGTQQDEGIVPRAVKLLLGHSVQGRDTIALSVTEIYNDSVRDLLDPSCRELTLKDVGEMVSTDATMVPIATMADFASLSSQALGNRKTGVTNMNEHSSRSHMILTLEVRRGNRVASTMSLVDLAGSESASRANTKGVQLQEGGHINQSLLSLGNVVNAIVEGRAHVPYRESKLTRLLRHSLGGHGLTCIVCCVNPAKDNQDQTNTSLQFAQRAMKIKTDPVVQVTMPPLFMHQFAESAAGLSEDMPALCSHAYQRGLHDAFHNSLETAGVVLQHHTSHTALALHALNNCQRLLLAHEQLVGAEKLEALEQEYVRLKDAVASLQASRIVETKRAREQEVELETRRAKVSRLEKEFDVRSQAMDCEVAHWEYELAQARKAAVGEMDVLLAEESATRSMIGQEEATDFHTTASAMLALIGDEFAAQFEGRSGNAMSNEEATCGMRTIRTLCGIPAGAADAVCLQIFLETNAALARDIQDLEAAYAMVRDELDGGDVSTAHDLSKEAMVQRMRDLEDEERELKEQCVHSSRETSRLRVQETMSAAGGRRLLHVPTSSEALVNLTPPLSHVTPSRRGVDDTAHVSLLLQTPPHQHSLPPRPSTAPNYQSPYSQRAMAAGRSPAVTPKAAAVKSPRVFRSPAKPPQHPASRATGAEGAATIRLEVRSAIDVIRAEREKLLLKSPPAAASPLGVKTSNAANSAPFMNASSPQKSLPLPPPSISEVALRRRADGQRMPAGAGAYHLSFSPQLDVKMHESKPAAGAGRRT